MRRTVPLASVGKEDVGVVGGKNASLGEMLRALTGAGVRVPGGFATTADAYREFLHTNRLDDDIRDLLEGVDGNDVTILAQRGALVRKRVLGASLQQELVDSVLASYARMNEDPNRPVSVAVRSSATAEDLPDASFAGQQETYLNVQGQDELLDAMLRTFASLYTDRAISYRLHRGYSHSEVALSVGVQRMVRADEGASGVAFTVDTETGFDEVVFVTASYGLGELLVQGAIEPDEFYLHKTNLRAGRPAILHRRLGSKAEKMVLGRGGRGLETVQVPENDRACFSIDASDLVRLGEQALAIEAHYGRPMDIEWARDGRDGQIYIVQARPETVHSREGRVVERFTMKGNAPVLVTGRSVGSRVGAGPARVVADANGMHAFQDGDVLVADMTDPDWEPVLKRAAGIVTNRGGRTCHAAIIARELGIPAVVGTGNATKVLTEQRDVTVSCAGGPVGKVYEGRPEFIVETVELDRMPPLPVRIMMNVASPERAFAFRSLPNSGVGLARLEFVIANAVGIHPSALAAYPNVEPDVREEIERRSAAYGSPQEFLQAKLSDAIATIAAAFAPEPVIVRLSDFKSNEYAHLTGGLAYEPQEENPMIGWRGASRYRSDRFAGAFAAECRALRYVREEMGFGNVEIMIPFVRTVDELDRVLEIMARHGLERGRDALRIIMMCEIPSNALMAREFLERVDGFSIGSNDLTQFSLALDRDSALVADMFDERDGAVKALMAMAIHACKEQGKYVGICGQGPSDHPDFAEWLMEQGIDSISLNPDSVLETWMYLAGISISPEPR